MTKDKKKKKHRHQSKVRTAFGPMYAWTHYGTPRSGGVNNNPSPPSPDGGGQDGQGMPTPVLSPATPRAESKQDVIALLRKALGPIDEDGPPWAGFQVPNPAMVKMRGGGPSIGGPGFQPMTDPLPGGVYDIAKSPGISFKTDLGWRLWQAALDVISQDKTLQSHDILRAAMERSGIRDNQIDPSEGSLLKMGIEWALSDPNAAPTQRNVMR